MMNLHVDDGDDADNVNGDVVIVSSHDFTCCCMMLHMRVFSISYNKYIYICVCVFFNIVYYNCISVVRN